MAQESLFPVGIDATGKNVVIQNFGFDETTFFWSMETGLITFPGLAAVVNSNGIVAGDFIYDASNRISRKGDTNSFRRGSRLNFQPFHWKPFSLISSFRDLGGLSG